MTHVIELEGKVLLETKSYKKAYNFLAKKLTGGLTFGMDYQTLIAMGYAKRDTQRRCATPGCWVIVIREGEKYCKPCRWAGRDHDVTTEAKK